MSAPDDLTIKLDGREISGWEEIRVTRSVERLVSDFEVAMTERFPGTSDVVVKPGQPCEILLGEDLVLTGYVDRYIPEFTAHQHTVRLSGRSKCQDVVDCSAVWPGSQLMNGTVLTIAKTLCEPFGVSVNALNDVGAVIPQTNLNVGDTPFDVLEPMARLRGLLMYDDPQGNMVLSGVGKTKAASGFKEGQNVEAAGIPYTMDQRFTALEVEGPKLHEAVRLRAQELDVELGLWCTDAADALTPEVEAVAKQLAAAIEKAHAIGGPTMRDFTDAAYVPRPSGFMRQRVNGGWYNAGANLLQPSPQGLGEEAAAIHSQISPIRQAALNGKVYPEYVPLARRPRPYVRKGIEVRQFGTPAPAADSAEQ